MVRGADYGHPNRNRVREDSRYCSYYWPAQAGSAAFTPPLASLAKGSYDGVKEVLSNVFPAIKHDLLVSRFSTGNRGNDGVIKRLQLTGGPTGSVVVTDLIAASGLDIETGDMVVASPIYTAPSHHQWTYHHPWSPATSEK